MLSWLNSMKEKLRSPHSPRFVSHWRCLSFLKCCRGVLNPVQMIFLCFISHILISWKSQFLQVTFNKISAAAAKVRVEGKETEEAAELTEKVSSHPLSPHDSWDAKLGDEHSPSPSSGPFWGSIVWAPPEAAEPQPAAAAASLCVWFPIPSQILGFLKH